MLKVLLVSILCLISAACTELPTASTPTEESTAEVAAEQRLDVEVDGIALSLRIPPGWQGLTTEDDKGLSIVEHAALVQAQPPNGILIHIFVPELDDFPSAPDIDNPALNILRQITAMPEYVGTSHVSLPAAFEWDGHHAAYYLLGGDDGIDAMVIAVAVPPDHRLVVFNVAAPHHDASRIRTVLPDVLATLEINGMLLDSAALHNLPDPLDFPQQVEPDSTEPVDI